MRFENLYTTRMAAVYLGISEQAVSQNRLSGITVHPRLILFTRGELDWYKAQGIGRGSRHVPYPHLAEETDAFKAQFLTGVQVANTLGTSELAVRKNKLLQYIRYTFPDYERISLWRRSAIQFYRANKPKPGRKDAAAYWSSYSPIGE
jgi:hypothetical protein